MPVSAPIVYECIHNPQARYSRASPFPSEKKKTQMAPQKDLPGFYFDPEKNRYFPIKGPLPGSKRARPLSSTSSTSGEGLARGRRHHVHLARRKKLMESSKLLQSREINGGLLISKRGIYSFHQEYQKLLASHPEVWKYHNTTFVSDSALDGLHGVVQTSQGLKETHLLAMGGINCSISMYGIKNVRGHSDYGPNYMPEPVWLSLRESHDGAPGIFSNSAAFTSLSSSISCIKRIGRNTPDTTANVSNFRHALVTTLGSGVSGGSVYVLNLREPLNFSENSPGLNRRISKVSSCDCTIWTADTSCYSTKAAIGTNYGVSLISLETGRSSLVYRSRSDVLSQQFDLSGNILLCGIRNGAILAIDVRQSRPKCLEVSTRPSASRIQYTHKKPRRNLKSSNAVFMSSAVCSVVALQSDEQYFLGSSMDGSIKLFDRRFLNGDVQSYEGHINSHSHLQLAVNPSETLLLSGGEDCFVRIWSIKTSELIFEENVSNCIFSTVYWPSYGDFSYGYDEFLKHGENLYESTCSWGLWLGSREGLHYMRGA